MKYTLCITRQCNLACNYCYIGKEKVNMSTAVAEAAVDFALTNTPPEEDINIGFFGGEPLLVFERIKEFTKIIESHPAFDRGRVILTVVTNGTIFSRDIATFLMEHHIGFHLSCDGPPLVQDTFRCFPGGNGSSAVLENNIRRALDVFPAIPVNAVYHPRTFQYLPRVIDYFSSLGLKQVYLNPDFSAPWTQQDANQLPEIYNKIGEQYINFYERDNPHFINLIDSKIAVILRGGFQPRERCRIGNILNGFTPGPACTRNESPHTINIECQTCGFKDYCMNWCGCSNFFSSGQYNKVGPFLCASERASIKTAFNVFQKLEQKLGPVFFEHLTGLSSINSIANVSKF